MNKPTTPFWLTSRGAVALCAIVFISYFLLMEHRQHLAAWLPYGILLLCPLMHLFMHRGHGHHHSSTSEDDRRTDYQRGYEVGLQDRQEKNRIQGGGDEP